MTFPFLLFPFLLVALVTIAGAIAAMSFRNLVHCALSLVVTFAGLAALFLQLNAQFVGFAQVLVYIGAVAILIVFAILLTRGTETPATGSAAAPVGWSVCIAVAVFVTLGGAVLTTRIDFHDVRQVAAQPDAGGTGLSVTFPEPAAPVRNIGEKLMTDYVLPLEVVGLLLTAAMIGAVIIALPEKRGAK